MGSLALQACSQSDGQTTGSNADRDQVIALAVANGNGIATRAGRPLLSSEANHTIENVVVYVVKASDNTVVATKTFSDWQNESADYRTDDGRYAEFLLDDRLDDGDYRIFAVGYHNDSAYGDIPGTLVPAGTFQENAVLSLAADAGAEELFAGSTGSFSVTRDQGFKKEIVLNRQVAGVYVYAREIPYMEQGTRLRLVSSAENNRLVLGHFSTLDLTDNGTGSGVAEAVVNGTSADPAFDKVLATIDLAEWFVSIEDADGDNLIDTGIDYANWRKPARYNGVATFEKGSVFAGEFVIPFARVDATQSLKLQLTTAGGVVKREWNVNLRSTSSPTTRPASSSPTCSTSATT